MRVRTFNLAIFSLFIAIHSLFAQSALFNFGGTFPVGSGGGEGTLTPKALAVGDFDGNGKLDLAVANEYGSDVTILLGDGKGGFVEATGSPIPLPWAPTNLAVGDFNQDGKLDLAVATFFNASVPYVMILLGNGSGGFTAAPGNGAFASQAAYGIAVADLNRDGIQDLILVSGSVEGSSWLGDGSGGFAFKATLAAAISADTAAIADVDGDGNPDVITPGRVGNQSGLVVSLGDGTGGFKGANSFPNSAAGNISDASAAVAEGDFNGDGRPDFITADPASGVTLWLNGTSGGASVSLTPSLYRLNPASDANFLSSIVTGDFNGDGNLDWAVASANAGNVTVGLGDGKGGFTAAPGSPFLVGGVPFSIAAGDFNGDGNLDLAVATGTAVVLLLNGGAAVRSSQPQVINFGPITSRTFSPIPFGITATASSGLPVTFASATPAVCAASGNMVTMLATGDCAITASQPGNAAYSAAVPVTQGFSIAPAAQTIVFPQIATQVLGTAPLTLTATASSGLPVTFASQSPGVCAISENMLTLIATGVCFVSAQQMGNSNYSGTNVSQSFTISLTAPQSQTIAFPALSNRAIGSAPFAITATATSGLPVSFTSSTPTVCSTLANFVTLLSQGVCSITATQAGNAMYNAAAPVSQSFTVTGPGQTAQTITFAALPGRTFGVGSIGISASASSGLTVSFSSATPLICSVTGTTITILSAGTCSITATQGGNGTFAAAAPVTQSFVVSPASQTIVFFPIGQHGASDAPFALDATASSFLPVAFSVVSGPAMLNGEMLTITGVGSVTIQASQAGSANYLAATPVNQTFNVILGAPSIAAIENAASYGVSLAASAYAVAFGASFEAPTPSGVPGTVVVTVTDAQGSQNTVTPFYAGFGQIDFLMPPGLTPSSATVTISNSAGASRAVLVGIGNIAPGLFTADASGSGAPAGQALIVAADGSQTILPLAQCQTAPLVCSTTPIPLAAGTQVYLLLYGTGIRGGGSFSVSIDGVPAPVSYAGPQGQFPGLDQVNVAVPLTLAGASEVSLSLRVDGQAANTVRVRFQ